MTIPDGIPFDTAALDDPRVRLALIASMAVVVATGALRVVLHRLDERARRCRAQLVAVAAPPEVDAAGSVLLWQHLAQCERSAWTKFWRGQPHLVYEYDFAGPRLTVRIWVPGGVSVPMVRDAVAAAWPGAQTTVTDIGDNAGAREGKRR